MILPASFLTSDYADGLKGRSARASIGLSQFCCARVYSDMKVRKSGRSYWSPTVMRTGVRTD